MVMAEVVNGWVGVSHTFCDGFWSGSTLPICLVLLSLWPEALEA